MIVEEIIQNLRNPQELLVDLNEMDPYEVLGIYKTAYNMKQLKRHYRRLAKKYHPDRNRGDSEKGYDQFKKISTAYSMLTDKSFIGGYGSDAV